MKTRDLIHRGLTKVRRMRGLGDKFEGLAIQRSEAPARLAEATSDLQRLFYGHRGRVVHKWVHYLPIYERYLSRYRATDFRMLEIGVFKGGSLEMWRNYFGPDATLFGIDIDPACADCVDSPNQVRIGSQDDPEFLNGVIAEMGRPDVILDDGSHIGRHQRTSFDVLFPVLAEGGFYMIEDTHTSYWPGYLEGGYRRSGTAIEFAKQIIDDMHGWYHGRPCQTPGMDQVASVQIFDSIVVIEKGRRERPGHIQVGSGAN